MTAPLTFSGKNLLCKVLETKHTPWEQCALLRYLLRVEIAIIEKISASFIGLEVTINIRKSLKLSRETKYSSRKLTVPDS